MRSQRAGALGRGVVVQLWVGHPAAGMAAAPFKDGHRPGSEAAPSCVASLELAVEFLQGNAFGATAGC